MGTQLLVPQPTARAVARTQEKPGLYNNGASVLCVLDVNSDVAEHQSLEINSTRVFGAPIFSGQNFSLPSTFCLNLEYLGDECSIIQARLPASIGISSRDLLSSSLL